MHLSYFRKFGKLPFWTFLEAQSGGDILSHLIALWRISDIFAPSQVLALRRFCAAPSLRSVNIKRAMLLGMFRFFRVSCLVYKKGFWHRQTAYIIFLCFVSQRCLSLFVACASFLSSESIAWCVCVCVYFSRRIRFCVACVCCVRIRRSSSCSSSSNNCSISSTSNGNVANNSRLGLDCSKMVMSVATSVAAAVTPVASSSSNASCDSTCQ